MTWRSRNALFLPQVPSHHVGRSGKMIVATRLLITAADGSDRVGKMCKMQFCYMPVINMYRQKKWRIQHVLLEVMKYRPGCSRHFNHFGTHRSMDIVSETVSDKFAQSLVISTVVLMLHHTDGASNSLIDVISLADTTRSMSNGHLPVLVLCVCKKLLAARYLGVAVHGVRNVLNFLLRTGSTGCLQRSGFAVMILVYK